MSRRLPLIAAFAFAFAALNPSAHADTITQTMSISQGSGTKTHTFDKFDVSLGTLSAVTITVTEGLTVFCDVLNSADFSGGASAATYSNASATGTATVFTPDMPGPSSSFAFSVSTSPSSGTVGAVTGFNVIEVHVGQASGSTTRTDNVALANFGDYEGAGGATYVVTSKVFGSRTGSTSSSFASIRDQEIEGGSVEIVYTYTAVPEPASLVMFALGLGGVFIAGGCRRRAS
jgi:PEP-CTERM motif